MSNKGVCRTASATPGLLNTCEKYLMCGRVLSRCRGGEKCSICGKVYKTMDDKTGGITKHIREKHLENLEVKFMVREIAKKKKKLIQKLKEKTAYVRINRAA